MLLAARQELRDADPAWRRKPQRPPVASKRERDATLRKRVRRLHRGLAKAARDEVAANAFRESVLGVSGGGSKADRGKPTKVHSIDKEAVWVEGVWLYKHGKASSRQQQREQFRHMKKWFSFLDTDGSGNVSAEDLLDPLVSLGFAHSTEEVTKLLARVATNKRGEISFEDFLDILRPRKGSKSIARSLSYTREARERDEARGKLARLFLDLWTSELADKETTFPLLMTAHRRKVLLNANCAPRDSRERIEGEAVLHALQKIHAPAKGKATSRLPASKMQRNGRAHAKLLRKARFLAPTPTPL